MIIFPLPSGGLMLWRPTAAIRSECQDVELLMVKVTLGLLLDDTGGWDLFPMLQFVLQWGRSSAIYSSTRGTPPTRWDHFCRDTWQRCCGQKEDSYGLRRFRGH